MKTRTRIGAILAAGALSFGVVGAALAIELKDVHQGITVSWDSNGDPVITSSSEEDKFEPSDECGELAQGEVVFHFVQSGPGVVVNAPGNNLLDVDFEDEADANDVVEDSIQNDSNVDWFVSVDASDGEVTLVNAMSNVAGNDDTLRVSHICVGDAPETETEAPSFEQSQEVETEEPSQVVETEEPSFEQSQEVETDEPSFEQSQEAETDAPSLPDTATVGGSLTGTPSDSAWMFAVALGLLLASIVVLTPTRAKAPRR